MNLLSARRLLSYLLPTEHLNPHLGDPLMSDVLYKDQRIKRKRELHPTPFFSLVPGSGPIPLAFQLPLNLLAGNRSAHSSGPAESRPSQPGPESLGSWAHPGLSVPPIGNYGKKNSLTWISYVPRFLLQ